jgi:16S rRNA (guanine966-N2)-methyltransferase
MLITSGELRGKSLSFPATLRIRPTSDKVRSAVFDIIRFEIKGSRFLDLFAGTGAVGIQALSEGSLISCFVEENSKCVNIVKENLKKTSFTGKAIIFKRKVEKFVIEQKELIKDFDFIFLDPPYEYSDSEYSFILENLKSNLKAYATIIVEHSKKRLGEDFFKSLGFENYKLKRYGDTALAILYN